MRVSGINSKVTINAVRESSRLSNIVANADIPVKDSANSPAIILDVSERARQATLDALEFKDKNDNDGSLNIDEKEFSEEFVKNLQQEAIDIMSRPTDPFTYEDQMHTLQYDFAANSPESTINDFLEGKAINSSVVTNELSNMLRQTVTNSDASVTERAEKRETALKCAEYITDKYLDDPDEAKEFMSAINDIYNEDVAIDKGYTEIDTDTGSVWVRKGSTLTSDGTVLSPDYAWGAYLDAYREANGISKIKAADLGDVFKEFISTSSETREELAVDGREEFVQNENNVTDAIEKVKLNFNYSLFNNSIARLLKAF